MKLIKSLLHTFILFTIAGVVSYGLFKTTSFILQYFKIPENVPTSYLVLSIFGILIFIFTVWYFYDEQYKS